MKDKAAAPEHSLSSVLLMQCNGNINSNGFCDTCFGPAQTSSNRCGRLIPVSSEPLEEKPTNEDVIKILGLTSTEEERTFFIKGYEYAKEKDKDELLLMVQDLEGYKSVVSSLESELKALREERDFLQALILKSESLNCNCATPNDCKELTNCALKGRKPIP